MPTCSETHGPNWVGEHPNCRYESSTPPGTGQEQTSFTGTVGSLGYGDILAGSSWEEDWQQFFDPYDPRREEMAGRHAGIDIGQLQSAWDLQSGQLGEAWGLREGQLGEAWQLRGGQLGEDWQQRREGLGAEAGLGYRNIFGAGQQARGKSGMAFAGGAEEMQRMQLQDVGGAYERAFGLGRTAYEQAMETGEMGYQQALETGELGYTQALETGELAVQQGTTDIYQGLESDIFGFQESWEEQNRATLNVLLGSGIWPGNEGRTPPPSDCVQDCIQEEQACADLGDPSSVARCNDISRACQQGCGGSPPPGDGGNGYTPPANTMAGTGSLVTGTQDMGQATGAKRYG